MLLVATGPHLWRPGLVVIEVEVDDVPHLLPAPVHHPIMAVKGQRAAKPAAQARQRAAGWTNRHQAAAGKADQSVHGQDVDVVTPAQNLKACC